MTRDGRFKFAPVFAGPGREIVYVELATPALYRLTRLDLESGTAEPLHPNAKTSEFDPAFSADGKAYAWLQTVGALRVNLVIQERDGGKLGEVQPGGGFSGMRSPAVSPDRQHVVYSFAEKGQQQLFEVRADGTEKRRITDSSGINNWPAYSQDGRALVFGSSRDGDFEIYRMPAAGGDAERLTHSLAQDIRPKFSPDGTRIAFTSHRDGNAEIYVMNADGSSPRRLTDSPDRDDYPEWHPDGRRLVIVSERDGRHDLYLLPIE
ncbi:MAG TPA: hypothetical protein VL475_03685 [Planctomycetaceae bacterium]|nr:hypothetical protein [Planctomycetaceae bacterium]